MTIAIADGLDSLVTESGFDDEFRKLITEASESLRCDTRSIEFAVRLLGPDGELRRQETVASHAVRVIEYT